MSFEAALCYGLSITFIAVFAGTLRSMFPRKATLREWQDWFGVRTA
jgi:hypothetical protein